jgi:hypothetical protein
LRLLFSLFKQRPIHPGPDILSSGVSSGRQQSAGLTAAAKQGDGKYWNTFHLYKFPFQKNSGDSLAMKYITA